MAILILAGLGFIVAGIIGAFFGYKVFKLYLAFIAFAAGFTFVTNLSDSGGLVLTVLGILAGLILAGLSFALYKFALFIVFAYLGANLGAIILVQFLNMPADWIVYLIGAVVGLGVANILLIWEVDKPAIAIVTALIGSYYICAGVALILGQGAMPESFKSLWQMVGGAAQLISSNIFYLITFIFFFVAGTGTQLKKWAKKHS